MKIKMNSNTHTSNNRKQGASHGLQGHTSKRLSCKAERKADRALRDMKRGGKRNMWNVEA